MLGDTFLILVSLLWVSVASVIDIKTREVPDWLSYSLILIGLSVRGIYALLFTQPAYFLYGLFALGLAYLFGSAMYYTRQWGGGDSKLLMGIAVIYATIPNPLAPFTPFPFLVSFLINMLIIGAGYGMLYTFYLSVRHYPTVLTHLRKPAYAYIRYLWIPLFAALVFFYFSSNFYVTIISLLLVALSAVLLSTTLIRIVEHSCMHKRIPVHRLTEGDWLVQPVLYQGKTLVPATKTGLEKEDILLLRQKKIKDVLVKEGMPFVPVFFLSLLVTLFYGPLFYSALTAFVSAVW